MCRFEQRSYSTAATLHITHQSQGGGGAGGGEHRLRERADVHAADSVDDNVELGDQVVPAVRVGGADDGGD